MEIELSQGKIGRISNHQHERIKEYTWWAFWNGGKWYAVTKIKNHNVYLHRFLLGVTDPRIQVDHKDGDGLNCQDDNIRICTSSQNNQNTGKRKHNLLYKGVRLRGKKYYARIRVDGKEKHLGVFPTSEAAALAYDFAAQVYYGDFAKTNLNGQDGRKVMPDNYHF